MKEANLGNAQHRAALALQIAQYLCSIDIDKTEGANENEDSDEKPMKRAVEVIREFAQPVDVEEQEHNGTYIIAMICIYRNIFFYRDNFSFII